jgi:hypothetical protein
MHSIDGVFGAWSSSLLHVRRFFDFTFKDHMISFKLAFQIFEIVIFRRLSKSTLVD